MYQDKEQTWFENKEVEPVELSHKNIDLQSTLGKNRATKRRQFQQNQLEACLTTTLDEFDQYIYHAISLYTDREEAEMLKNEIEILKEENNKLKHDMSEKEVLINGLTGKLHQERAKQIWKTEA